VPPPRFHTVKPVACSHLLAHRARASPQRKPPPPAAETRNGHLGIGLSETHIRNEARRDRLIFIAAIAHMLVSCSALREKSADWTVP
jgi:hypothetical protein